MKKRLLAIFITMAMILGISVTALAGNGNTKPPIPINGTSITLPDADE